MLIFGSRIVFGCIVSAALHALLIRLPTVFHSFGRMALLDDYELALPKNLRFGCRMRNQ